MDDLSTKVAVYIDEKLSQYGFGPQHPFSNDRLPAFRQAFFDQRLDEKVLTPEAVMATVEQVARFHTLDYIQTVQNLSETGSGYFDTGDTPVIKGIYQASLYVVGSSHRISSGTAFFFSLGEAPLAIGSLVASP